MKTSPSQGAKDTFDNKTDHLATNLKIIWSTCDNGPYGHSKGVDFTPTD
jgi:hypothetical protein